jgi:hypothetical protein
MERSHVATLRVQEKGSPTPYSSAYRDWLVHEYARDSDFFAKAREQSKHARNSALEKPAPAPAEPEDRAPVPPP